jgi:hypothetical protein
LFPRRVVVFVVAILLFGWVFLYRFNTLGGAFGGFDNDHFLYFALAKQVQAGDQPLRDFQDAMHGAWPSLTYEFSAAAQHHLATICARRHCSRSAALRSAPLWDLSPAAWSRPWPLAS